MRMPWRRSEETDLLRTQSQHICKNGQKGELFAYGLGVPGNRLGHWLPTVYQSIKANSITVRCY